MILRQAEQAHAPPRRILVIDDDPALRQLVDAYLGAHGYEMLRAGSSQEAFGELEMATVDLVLLDLALGQEDGFEILSRLRLEQPEMPVIIITGIGYDAELVNEAIERGARGYVSKTVPLAQLLMEVHRALNYPQRV